MVRRLLTWIVFVSLACTASGCADSMLWAVGRTEKVGLLTSFAPDDRRVESLVQQLQAPVQMVRMENRFKVDRIPLDLFKPNRDWKGLAVLCDLSRPTQFDDEIARLVSDEVREELAAEDVAYRLIEDVWAKGQCVLLMHAKHPDALEAYLRRNGPTVARSFDEALQVAMGPAVLAAGRDEDMESYVREHYGFDIGIPSGYLTGEDPEGRVIRLYRVIQGEPARFVLVHWLPREEAPQSVEEFFDLRGELAEFYYQGDYILRDRSSGFEGSFQQEPALVLEGVWQNDKFVIGGPFRSYGFVRGDRFFVVDVAVFNPPGKKLPYLRETLAIARTFQVTEAS